MAQTLINSIQFAELLELTSRRDISTLEKNHDAFPKHVKKIGLRHFWLEQDALEYNAKFTRTEIKTILNAFYRKQQNEIDAEKRKDFKLFGEGIDPLVMQFIRRPYLPLETLS